MKTNPEIDEIWLKEAEARLKAHREGKQKAHLFNKRIGGKSILWDKH
ncbi:MAG: addiction module protein [Candidatus Scalindua sp.]